jgi:hypothetical protein
MALRHIHEELNTYGILRSSDLEGDTRLLWSRSRRISALFIGKYGWECLDDSKQ